LWRIKTQEGPARLNMLYGGNMPRYKFDIKNLLFEQDVKKIYDLADKNREKLAIALLWTTGARPSELLALYKNNIIVTDTQVTIVIKTLKLGAKDFKAQDRPLVFERNNYQNVYLEKIIKSLDNLGPEQVLLPYTSRWMSKIINRLGKEAIGKEICPYHFRHSVMTWLSRNGATLDQLKHFKGAADYKSIWPYITAKKFVVAEQLSRRDGL